MCYTVVGRRALLRLAKRAPILLYHEVVNLVKRFSQKFFFIFFTKVLDIDEHICYNSSEREKS